MDEQKMKDFIFQAIQAGKRETSDLATDIIHKMKAEVADSVRIQVNGQLEAIKKTLAEQNQTMGEHFEKVDAHMDADNLWKQLYTPYIKGLANMTDGGKLMVRLVMGIATVGAAILAIKAWFYK